MEVLLYEDIFENLLAVSTEKADKKLIADILRNENAHILYSKKYFDYIQAQIGDDDLFLQIRKNIIDDNGKNIESLAISTSFEEEYSHLYEKSGNVVLPIAYHTNAEMPKIALISQRQKPNYHWFVTQLAALHHNPISLNCFDFEQESQIQAFFEAFFSLPKQIAYVNIFDRETNEISHNRFDTVKNRIKVHYYTLQQRDYFGIQDYFTQKLLLFKTRKKELTHGRRIIFENFVLISDNAFNNLKIGEDWNIQIEYNPSNARNWLSLSTHYQRVSL